MSWAKQSAEAGLVGLTEREAARGALCEEAFQLMPTPHVRHIIVVSKFKSRLILHVFMYSMSKTSKINIYKVLFI